MLSRRYGGNTDIIPFQRQRGERLVSIRTVLYLSRKIPGTISCLVHMGHVFGFHGSEGGCLSLQRGFSSIFQVTATAGNTHPLESIRRIKQPR